MEGDLGSQFCLRVKSKRKIIFAWTLLSANEYNGQENNDMTGAQFLMYAQQSKKNYAIRTPRGSYN